MTRVERREKLIDLVEDFSNAMLCTRTLKGQLRSRPMAIGQVTDEGDIFFVTAVDTAKAAEINFDEDVAITCQGDSRFVSASGKAELINDRELIRELYQKSWDAWFENGADDPTIRLLRVSTDIAEYWDYSGANALKFLWTAGKAVVGDETIDSSDYDSEQHAKVALR